MIKTKKAKKVLTKAEQEHLSQGEIHDMATLKQTIKHQQKTGVKCWDCRIIAKKLGVTQ